MRSQQRREARETHHVAPDEAYLEAAPSAPPLNRLNTSTRRDADDGPEDDRNSDVHPHHQQPHRYHHQDPYRVIDMYYPPPPFVPPPLPTTSSSAAGGPTSFPFPFPMPSSMMPEDRPWPLPPADMPYIPPPPPGFRFDSRAEPLSSGSGHHHDFEAPHHRWPSPSDVPLPSVFPFPPPFLPPPPFPEWVYRQQSGEGRHTHPEGSKVEGAASSSAPKEFPDLPWLPPRGEPDQSRIGSSGHHHDAPRAAMPSYRSASTSYDEQERLRGLVEQARRKFAHDSSASQSRSASNASIPEYIPSSVAGPERRYRQPSSSNRRVVESDSKASTLSRLTPAEQARLKQEREDRINARRHSVFNRTESSSFNTTARTRTPTPKYASHQSSATQRGTPPATTNRGSGALKTQHATTPRDVSRLVQHHHQQRTSSRPPQQRDGGDASTSAPPPPPQEAARSSNSEYDDYEPAPEPHDQSGINKTNTDKSYAKQSSGSGAHTPRATHQGNNNISGTANRGGLSTTTSFGMVRTPQAQRAARGVTLRSLKGETPDLKRAMTEGLPSERARMEGFNRSRDMPSRSAGGAEQQQQQSTIHSNHHMSQQQRHEMGAASPPYIGFGATQYTPFVELAKQDPRAAEYLRGIESLYHNLRSSYQEFQSNPEKFLKGPSAAAIQKAVLRGGGGGSDGAEGVGSPMKASGGSKSAAGNSTTTATPLAAQREGSFNPIEPITPPRLPLYMSDLAVNAEPSAETRKLREELDRLEHQWQRLSDIRAGGDGIGVEGSAASTVGGGGGVSSSVWAPTSKATAASSPGHQIPSSVAANSSSTSASPYVFTYENVLGLVRERRQQLSEVAESPTPLRTTITAAAA